MDGGAGALLFCRFSHMNFARLQQLTARNAASAFVDNAAGKRKHAWFPPGPEDKALTRADYLLCIANVTSGPMRARAGDPLQALLRTEQTLTVLLPCPLPYEPKRDTTTFLMGTSSGTALRYRIAEFRAAGGIMELDAVLIQSLPVG